jgi:NADH dehydrogenase
MHLLITGASGFVGREVLRQARAAGHRCRVLARDPGNARAHAIQAEFNAELRAGDVLDALSLVGAAEGCDAVIHLVGIISEVGRQKFEHVHVSATRNVLAAARSAGVQRYIHMSALGTRPHAASRYHQTKWAAEESVRASGLDWTVLRPSLVFGPEDHFVNLFARLSKWSPVLPVMGPGRAQLQPVAVEDVAACFVRAVTQPESAQATLDVCGPERFTLPEILREILAALGRRRWLLHIPLPVARTQAAILEAIFPRLLRQAPPLNRDQLLMLQEDNTGNPEPANRLFGIKPMGFKEGIRKYLRPAGR